MTSKTSRTTNFSEQEKLLSAELRKDFPEVESKGYDSKTLTKKAKAWEEILTRFNSQIPNGIKRDLSQLQGCWRRLKLQSKKEHDLHCRETRKTGASAAATMSNGTFSSSMSSSKSCSRCIRAKLCSTAVATIMTRVFGKAVRSPKCRQGKRRFSNPKHLSITHLVRLCAVL